ncbi:hypothetical protein QMK19_40075 [Streptomyces sp. H10-C2]|uniref:hypothetical protein n=1 Tax=unclassified Streptomyces TaxID=2593676 RepID=UPI0024B8F187|nr:MULTISPECIES: hypothetical protein [unclassified Streptomyces]MDJ0347376.1 hypothetical protein [Streptomyces sp. PH10-H1]MDJ0375619.1 hypothetical protein [Streptomyces sp. H10-C2]
MPRGRGNGVLEQGLGVDRPPCAIQALALHRQQQMVVQQRHPRPGLVVTEACGNQTARRPDPVHPVFAEPDDRHVILDPLQHLLDRALVRCRSLWTTG